MIIDLILDRYGYNGDKSGVLYRAKNFYNSVLEYENTLDLSHDISVAMDYDGDAEIKQALCDYVINSGYNPKICDFINGVSWLTDDGGYYEALNDMTDSTGKTIFERGRMYGVYSISTNGDFVFKIDNKMYCFERSVFDTCFMAF